RGSLSNNVPTGTAVKDSVPATTVLPASDRLTLLAVDPNFALIDVPAGASNLMTGEIRIPAARVADFTVGEIYYMTSGGTAAFGTVTNINAAANTITWAEGDAFGLNQFGAAGSLGVATNRGASPATLRQVNIIHYFADADGRLVRRAFGVRQSGFIDSVVAEHLKALNFRYVLTPGGTGTIFEQPREQIELADSVRVRMIEPSLEVETAYPLQDGHHGQVDGVSQIGIRNIAFLEAPVPLDSQGNTRLPNPGPLPHLPPPPPPPSSPTPVRMPTPARTPTATPQPTPTRTPTPRPTPTPGKGDG
ncbi:MAG: hypothetical protein M3R11_07545, partial [Acidobacteriota bacterium]|nr:hypothetical protein [Acidobacteriota bacterium]